MELQVIITVTGLAIDIFGAVLLAKSIFFETTEVLVDTGGLKRNMYDRTRSFSDHYTNAATQIVDRCKEILQTRIGLFLLVIGFILQLIAQFLPTGEVTMIQFMVTIIAIFLMLATLLAYLFCELIERDEKLKQDALIEMICRITPHRANKMDSSLNLPAGMAYSEIEKVCDIFLKRPLLFEGFAKDLKESEKTPAVWLELEIQRRYLINATD